MATWKRDFASGLILLVPLLVVLVVLRWIYRQVAGVPLIGTIELVAIGVPPSLVPVARTVIALTVFTTVVLAAGYFMRTTLGRVAEEEIDDFMNRLPALRVVYNASKLAVETALSGTEDLQAPVYLETWAGIRMTAFKTGKRTRDGKVVLFMPTAPNITSGFVIEVEPERIDHTGETTEEALTRILSAGFAESPHQIPVEDEEDVLDESTDGADHTRIDVGQRDHSSDDADDEGRATGSRTTDGNRRNTDRDGRRSDESSSRESDRRESDRRESDRRESDRRESDRRESDSR
ncbi:hypothetical protein AArcSl_1824 [Halalkaliarchaeum desulfuricum]|uniref:DUF502 domain-containing protein n=1 Tax=Halalkaliarchaeum desulfuricum TaxID=2055893 RepID=A0A343TK28_9EURY|nr:hypothetical protein AArcSl_1824 [Halalkaliarchaeum desulfuricum]